LFAVAAVCGLIERDALTPSGGFPVPELSILNVLQLAVGLGLLNVWLVRAGSATGYRGGDAKTLREEFRAYGLPDLAFYVVGGLKVAAGVVLIAGVWMELPVRVAAGIVAVLMVGALAMHLKVGDPPNRSVPAALMLLMSGAILLLA
jgi:uncharacterized membrane protein YphA (DoxX/SURF4 family)